MEIIFTDEYLNILLLFNGLIILMYYGAKIKTKNRAMNFGNYETLKKVSKRDFLRMSDISLVLRVLAFSLIILGLSGPIIVTTVPATDSSYVMTIDSSASMTTSDIAPTRLGAATDISSDFVSDLPEESEVGLVVYSGDIDSQTSLTSDKDEIQREIQNISLGDTAGTATGDAIISGSTILSATDKNKQVILITDGTQNVGSSINESVEFANRRNVTVNVIGIGGTEDIDQELDRDGLQGNEVDFPNLQEDNLRNIAEKTNGTLNIIVDRDGFETAFEELRTEEVEREGLEYFIFAGLALLLIEWFTSNTRTRILP